MRGWVVLSASDALPALSMITPFTAPFRLEGLGLPMNRNVFRSYSSSCSRAFPAFHYAMEDIQNRELFEYTSGRWMYVLFRFFKYPSR